MEFWLKRIELFCLQFDSKNFFGRTELFLQYGSKELNLYFSDMAHRIEIFFQHYLKKGTFFQFDSMNWTFFFQSDS